MQQLNPEGSLRRRGGTAERTEASSPSSASDDDSDLEGESTSGSGSGSESEDLEGDDEVDDVQEVVQRPQVSGRVSAAASGRMRMYAGALLMASVAAWFAPLPSRLGGLVLLLPQGLAASLLAKSLARAREPPASAEQSAEVTTLVAAASDEAGTHLSLASFGALLALGWALWTPGAHVPAIIPLLIGALMNFAGDQSLGDLRDESNATLGLVLRCLGQSSYLFVLVMLLQVSRVVDLLLSAPVVVSVFLWASGAPTEGVAEVQRPLVAVSVSLPALLACRAVALVVLRVCPVVQGALFAAGSAALWLVALAEARGFARKPSSGMLGGPRVTAYLYVGGHLLFALGCSFFDEATPW